MGAFGELVRRALTQPVVRRVAPDTDWRSAATAAESAIAAGSEAPLLIDDEDPLALAAQTMTALLAGRDVFLCSRHWTQAERTVAITLAQQAGPAGNGGRVMIATGGTSGALRFAIHTLDTLVAAALALAQQFPLSPLNSLCVLPLHHISGFQQLIRALATGGTLLLGDWKEIAGGARPPLPAGAWALSLVPAQLQRLLDDPAAAAWLRGFAVIFLGGAPASEPVLDRARTAGLPLALAYGSTETAAQFALQSPAAFRAGERGLQPLPHAALRILNTDTGIVCPPGTTGRIEVAAASLFHGYWPTLRPASAWSTDDLGWLDRAGRLHLAGRLDQAINTGGEKVFPAEVEAALLQTGAFSEVVVMGLPDARWGEGVTAFFPAADTPDLERVEATLREKLSAPKRPRRWVPIPDWPRNAQGKVDRAALLRFAREPIQQ